MVRPRNVYTSPRLRFALCDPAGVPFMVAHSPGLCLGWYVDMRGGIILDKDSEEAYFDSMRRRKWSVRNIETKVEVFSEIGNVRELRRHDNAERRQSRRDSAKTKPTKKTREGQTRDPKEVKGKQSKA